ncbi:endonuclease/exonuclease/phosphatase family protein [Anaeromyxobacter sp. SG17]|uniref:endonuclease/exonuclease/phosphatase family protein n=1 Tax=Anaeromyxobacter sp. SG17 TaxID=2925405 RepID=UPI001F5AF908|nr:endonuclease/exonuclease/phosphatase family protein [Anaeromyxobacter sp. SG17]
MRIRSCTKALSLAVALAVTSCGGRDGTRSGAPAGPIPVKGMTWNVLHGGAFDRVLSETGDLPAAFDALWAGVVASDPPARMRKVAAEIASARPDLVGLQEAALWRAELRDGSATIEYDLVGLVLAELRARGAAYSLVSLQASAEPTLPGARGSYRFADRVAVLARDGLAVSNPRGGLYATRLPLPVPLPGGGSFGVPRAWTSVDVELDGRRFRFLCTHLETVEAVSAGQAAELVTLAGADLPVIVVGDMNSAPGDDAYELLVNGTSGLRDAWEAGEGAGLTCCRDSLTDPAAGVTQRVDLVLQRGFTARSAALAGADAASFEGGRWPSDHVGVVAELELP